MFETLPLTLSHAASQLFEKTQHEFFQGGALAVIVAGARGMIPIYWNNPTQKFSCLLGFSGEIQGSDRAHRLMRLSARDLGRLEADNEIEVFCFAPDDDDVERLDAAGSDDGFRVMIEAASTTVRRKDLCVRQQDVLALVEKATAQPVPPSKTTLKSDRDTPVAPLERTSAARQPTVQQAIAPYVKGVMLAHPNYTAEQLNSHCRRHAGDIDSPFSRLANGGKLFCIEASKPCGQSSVTAALTAYRKTARSY